MLHLAPLRPELGQGDAARLHTGLNVRVGCNDKEGHTIRYGLRMCSGCSDTEPCRECHGPDAPRFRRCARCKVAIYCGVDCQRKHWPYHKPHCISMTDEEYDRKEHAAYAQYRRDGLTIEPTMHMSAVMPLFHKWMEIYSPLLIVAALNAWHFVGPHPEPLGPRILEIDAVLAPKVSMKTKAAKAFLVRDARPYTVPEFNDMVAGEAWHTLPEFRNMMAEVPELSKGFRERYERCLKDREDRTDEIQETYSMDRDCMRTNMICVVLWFDNEIFRNVFVQHVCYTDYARTRRYAEPGWVDEEDWLGFLKTNIAAGKTWSREGISI